MKLTTYRMNFYFYFAFSKYGKTTLISIKGKTAITTAGAYIRHLAHRISLRPSHSSAYFARHLDLEKLDLLSGTTE